MLLCYPKNLSCLLILNSSLCNSFLCLSSKLGVLDAMSTDIKSSNGYSEPTRSVGRNLEFKRNSRQQQSPNVVKENLLSTQACQYSKFKEKVVAPNPFSQLSTDSRPDGELMIRQKSSVTRQKQQQLVSNTNKDDELVKYMSNLPGYLQQAAKQENIQVKALNFGVLDWNHLEKWKYNERMTARGQQKATSSGNFSDMESGKPTMSKTSVVGDQPSAHLHINSATEIKLSEFIQQPKGKPKHIKDPRTTAGQQKDFCHKVKNANRSCPWINHDKGKKKKADWMTISQQESLSLDQTEHGISMSSLPAGNQQGKSRTGGDNDMNCSPKYSNAEPQNIEPLMPKCSSKSSFSQNSWSVDCRISSNGRLVKDARNRYPGCFSSYELESGEFYNEIPCFSSLPTGVAIARDRESDFCVPPCQNDNSIKPQSSEARCPKARICYIDGQVSVDACEAVDFDNVKQTKSRTSSHGQLADGNMIKYSDYFSSQETHNGELYYEIPHSCPLPASVAISQGRESDGWKHPFQSDASTELRSSGATCSDSKSCNLDDLASFKSFKGMDLDFAKQTASKGRQPSPNWRFSFSLGKLSRSFSFKESSTVMPLSSKSVAAKSDRENSSVFAAMGDSKRDKANASGRRRPSPFRRLLDPLLKPKGARSIEAVQSKGALSAETFGAQEKNSSFVSMQPIDTSELLAHETNQASTFRALLQLTIKNGLPFFKFVVDNRSDILAAVVKQLQTPGNGDRTLTFSFYSVHKIKKKTGSWINNVPKEKSCGFGYDIVGQMKISRSFFSELNAECCSDQFLVTESVLYDVNIAKGDKGAPEVSPNREIAAIIFKEPAAKCNGRESKGGHTHKQKGIVGSSPGITYDHGEKETFSSTTVILPGGFHSLPVDGVPSSIVHRWKSGGLCDCGGWDVGCKLKVLANHKKGLTPAMSCSMTEHMNLFIQGGEGNSQQPIFSLAPFKDGFHSIEFHASVSLLEAFSICVAVITSRDLSDIFNSNHLPQSKVSVEAKNENDEKNKIMARAEVPTKYVSSPPPSPVGRI
ncbi:hypothetical protein ACH5RR_004922 [Cinchona calisaya]|uniref:DUF3527 domain protein n=1 Tax=Cinchona calisaya TaxID=153742 RepID=A0ABD3AZ39_9GENT